MYDLEVSNDVDPLETPYTGSTLDLIHGQVHRRIRFVVTRNKSDPSSKHVCSTARLAARPHALRPCACLPRGCHFKWNEHLYRSARRRPQLNPRGPAACGHRRFDCVCQLWTRGYTLFALVACNRTRQGASQAGHLVRTVPMFASPAVHTRRSALAAQLRRKYFGIRQFSSRDLAVQRDEHHPCWKA